MEKQMRMGMMLLCIIGGFGSVACGSGGHDKEYKTAVEAYSEELEKERVPWINTDGTETSISNRAFKFTLLDINPGKLPDMILLKDTGRNLSDDETYIVCSNNGEHAFQVITLTELKGYYPNTGIYVSMKNCSGEDGTYFYDSEGERYTGKIEEYYYLPDCRQKDAEEIHFSGMETPIGAHFVREDNEESIYNWYGFYDQENFNEYMEHIQGDCSVSKEEFEKHLAEYIGNTKLTEVSREDFHDNTEENRKKYFK